MELSPNYAAGTSSTFYSLLFEDNVNPACISFDYKIGKGGSLLLFIIQNDTTPEYKWHMYNGEEDRWVKCFKDVICGSPLILFLLLGIIEPKKVSSTQYET